MPQKDFVVIITHKVMDDKWRMEFLQDSSENPVVLYYLPLEATHALQLIDKLGLSVEDDRSPVFRHYS